MYRIRVQEINSVAQGLWGFEARLARVGLGLEVVVKWAGAHDWVRVRGLGLL